MQESKNFFLSFLLQVKHLTFSVYLYIYIPTELCSFSVSFPHFPNAVWSADFLCRFWSYPIIPYLLLLILFVISRSIRSCLVDTESSEFAIVSPPCPRKKNNRGSPRIQPSDVNLSLNSVALMSMGRSLLTVGDTRC